MLIRSRQFGLGAGGIAEAMGCSLIRRKGRKWAGRSPPLVLSSQSPGLSEIFEFSAGSPGASEGPEVGWVYRAERIPRGSPLSMGAGFILGASHRFSLPATDHPSQAIEAAHVAPRGMSLL